MKGLKKRASIKMPTENSMYEFFRPQLRDESYAIGDVYSPDEVRGAQAEWDISSDKTSEQYPYLTHVKALSNTWPHLRLLADFMEVGTTPLRWKDLSTVPPAKGPDLTPEQKAERIKKREERAKRTNVMLLKYMSSGTVKETPCKTVATLVTALEDEGHEKEEEVGGSKNEASDGEAGVKDACKLRLFVVEDLSRDVIEALGSKLNIEPAFFREQIVDYAWCNIRDRWQDPPGLRVAEGHRRWVQLRYVTARYYKTSESFEKGFEDAAGFNVLRRPDDDLNNKAVWDDKKAIVGIMRTRASFWLREGEGSKAAVAVLLLDPTVTEGTPLWYGYRNWEPTPSMPSPTIPPGPPRDSLFNDFIYWAKMTSPPATVSTTPTSTNPHTNTHLPVQSLLYLICSEWLTIAAYIRTRIGQIEWEVSIPDHFLIKGVGIDEALKKLHPWRRLVPLYREMLTDTLQEVFKFPCHANNITVSLNGVDTTSICPCAVHAPPSSTTACPCPQATPLVPTRIPITSIKSDFARALSYMEEYQLRIDRLTSVVTAIISIEDSRRSQDDNRNVARLTWLATFFIPLSYIASLFSMQPELSTLVHTMRIYFATAVPVAALALGLAWVLTLPWLPWLLVFVRSWGWGSRSVKNKV